MSPDQSRSCGRRVAVCLLFVVAACGGGGDTTAPPPQVPTSIDVEPRSFRFESLGEARNLVATVRDESGDSIPGAIVAWRSSNDSVVTVTSSGFAAAVMNGSAEITATAGTATAQVGITVAQVPRLLVKVSGDSQTARLGGDAVTKGRSFWNDALLASQCASVGATLVTTNTADFRRLARYIPVKVAAPFP